MEILWFSLNINNTNDALKRNPVCRFLKEIEKKIGHGDTYNLHANSCFKFLEKYH